MQRRTFLGGLTASSFGALLENAFAQPARALAATRTGGYMAGEASFETSLVEVSGDTSKAWERVARPLITATKTE